MGLLRESLQRQAELARRVALRKVPARRVRSSGAPV
eukprot:CAMPEP_0179163762 /NCGR_PEP_ID=MMETSP0796-20121207/80317_1 /TAXON_ID=73915 /ORGANISM="Pyrodinium bahamense, Strain pbaha01" /LENGTH=35 /DNA_ID= /DNA_START= /DNA_END= /DNA_ORIENTATION=